MNGSDLRRLRERREWSQSDLALALNASLDSAYNGSSVSVWENEKRPVPKKVQAVVESLLVDAAFGGDDETSTDAAETADDTAPGPSGVPPAQPGLVSSTAGVYAKACEELWEIVGAGVGMVGAATGSEALIVDGQIIVGDKRALGQAWGRLAETNDTFRKMLVSMTEGGAWLQVAIVTGTTAAKLQQNHASRTLAARAAQNGHVEPAEASTADGGF